MAMPAQIDRGCLSGLEMELFRLVIDGATVEQWREWLRVPLEHALAEGNMNLVGKLMDAGADTSAGWKGCNGRTLIAAAAEGGDEEAVRAMLDAGAEADVNVTFGVGYVGTPLFVAVENGAEAAARAILRAGADATVVDGFERGVLHAAAEAGQHRLVTDLLCHGAHPSARDISGETPLHLAADGGHERAVSALLEGKADANAVNESDESPLYRAVCKNHIRATAKLLVGGADVNLRCLDADFDGASVSVLEAAVGRGYGDMVQTLLGHGAHAYEADSSGTTALHAIHRVRDKADAECIINALLAAGADIDARDADGVTPMHLAVHADATEPVVALLAAGADICAGGGGYTALHLAAGLGHFDVVRALVRGGVDVNAQDDNGDTPLHLACLCGSADAALVLLRLRARESITNSEGKRPIDLCSDHADLTHAFATADADKRWRRRRAFVLSREFPDRVVISKTTGGAEARAARRTGDGTRLQQEEEEERQEEEHEEEEHWSYDASSDGIESDSSPCRNAGAGGVGRYEADRGGGDSSGEELHTTVGRVVGLGSDAVFRLVVEYL